jgi:hypothetical protein
MNKYVVQDISTADKWAISFVDGELKLTTTSESASDNPIVQDDTNAGTYWTICVDAGQISVVSTVTAQDDEVDLYDSTAAKTFRLSVNDGQLNYYEVETVLEGSVFSISTSLKDWFQQKVASTDYLNQVVTTL